MIGIGGMFFMGAGAAASSATNSRRGLEKIEAEGRLHGVGFVKQAEGVILSPEEILGSWKVPTSELRVEVGSVPLAVMQEIIRNPEVLRRLDSRQFENTVAEILHDHGFKDVKLTPRSGDGGKDITAHQVVFDIPIFFYFECKQYREDRPVELGELRALLGTVLADKIDRGVLVTTSRFTRGGREFIAENVQLRGAEYDDLVGWVERLR